jgi:hypothetical protein
MTEFWGSTQAYHSGLSLQLMLGPGPDIEWVDDLRSEVYPGQCPAHVSVLANFALWDDGYLQLREEITDIVQDYRPFLCRDDGVTPWKNKDKLVAISLVDKDDILGDLWAELEVWCV